MEQESEKRGTVWRMVRTRVLKYLLGEGEEGAKEMLRDEWLPWEKRKTVGLSWLLRGKRSKKITQLNISSPRETGVFPESQRE